MRPAIDSCAAVCVRAFLGCSFGRAETVSLGGEAEGSGELYGEGGGAVAGRIVQGRACPGSRGIKHTCVQ
jgi:hypothetical protein